MSQRIAPYLLYEDSDAAMDFLSSAFGFQETVLMTARSAGAVIEREPKDQVYGDRTYAAFDPEGHHWYFAQSSPALQTKPPRRPRSGYGVGLADADGLELLDGEAAAPPPDPAVTVI